MSSFYPTSFNRRYSSSRHAPYVPPEEGIPLAICTISAIVILFYLYRTLRPRREVGEGARDGWPPETARDMVKPQLFDVLTTGNGIPGRSLSDHRPLTWADLKPLSLTIGKPVSPSPQNSDTYPVRAPNPPRDPVLIVSTMIAMPTPPPVNPRILSEDTFPPVLFGVTQIPIPCGWASADV